MESEAADMNTFIAYKRTNIMYTNTNKTHDYVKHILYMYIKYNKTF